MDEENAAETVQSLTVDMPGIWLVSTENSTHRFDLTGDMPTVTRAPGRDAREMINDQPLWLRGIDVCTVGERGWLTDPAVEGETRVAFAGDRHRTASSAAQTLGRLHKSLSRVRTVVDADDFGFTRC